MGPHKGIIFASSTGKEHHACYIFTKKVKQISLKELSGHWMLYDVTSGKETGWKSAELTLASDGRYTGTLKRSDGASNSITGKISTNTEGTISLNSEGSYIIFSNGAINETKSFITATATDGKGNINLIMMVKKAKAYSPEDLTRPWRGKTFQLGLSKNTISSVSMGNSPAASKSGKKAQPVMENNMTVNANGKVVVKGVE